MLKKYKLLTLAIFLGLTNAWAQPDIELANEQKKHPDDFLIYTQRKKDIDISLKDGKLYITSDVFDELFILKNLAVLDDEESVDYSNFYKLLNLEAYTLVPSKNSYKKVEVKEFKDRHVFDNMVFHDDVNEKVFNYPNLTIGAKKVLHYKQEFTQAQLLDGFFFSSSIFCNSSKLTITVDQNIDLGFKMFNTKDYPIQFKEEIIKNRKVYTWEYVNSEKLKLEDNVFSPRYYIPHILYHIKSYTYNGNKTNVLSNLDDLHTYYTRFLKDLNLNDNPELKQIADSITVGSTDEVDKIKKIYYWVKENIRYIAFEDGFGGFIPRDAKEVCDKKFGDCKDMANLLVSMIRSVGIKNVYHTWIGSNSLPYKYEDIPSTSVDNHMIATYIKDGKYIFLDATSKYTPWGMPSEFIQNKEAMIHIDKDRYDIVNVPIVDPSVNNYISKATIQFDGDTLKGRGEVSIYGYFKDYMLEVLSDDSGDKRKKEIKPYLELGNNKFYIDNYTEQNTKERDKNYIINYDFGIPNYGINVDNKKYVNLFLDKYYEKSKIDTTRKNDMYYRYADRHSFDIVMNIPTGYKVNFLPKNNNFDNDLMSFTSELKNENNQIFLTYTIVIKKMIVKKEEFEKWNQSIDKLQKIYSENIALIKQ